MTTSLDFLAAHVLLRTATGIGLVLCLGLLIPAAWSTREFSPVFRIPRQVARSIARNGFASLLCVFLIAWASGASNGILKMPTPSVNDEFGYLLAADTFAQGRLANPQHSLYRHFETFAVSHSPTYVSKYPPASAAFMAVGQWTFGHPWWGQLIAFSLGAMCVSWMLRAWIGPRWGLIGGIFIALHPVMQHFSDYDYNWSNYSWSHSYWGGSVTMMGAALLFGGLRRVIRNGRASDALFMSLGIALLAFSRPFEGFIATAIAIALLLRHLVTTGKHDREKPSLLRIVVPMLLVGIPSILFLAHYNEVTTGDPFRLAHQHYADQYGTAAEFLIQAPRVPPESYGNGEMERFYMNWVRPAFLSQTTDAGAYWHFKSEGVERFVWFYVGMLFPALLGTIALVHRRWWRLAGGFTLLTFGLIFITFEFHPHYAAAAAPFIIALLVGGMAELWRRRGERAWMAHALVIVLVVLGTVPRVFDLPTRTWGLDVRDWPRLRESIVTDLESVRGNDLVIVSYKPDHSVFQEFVKNGADLDEGSVVWARDLGTEESRRQLLDYYADRKVWIFLADANPPVIKRYVDRGQRTSSRN